MKNILPKSTGNQLSANEFTVGVQQEPQNFVTDTGQTLDESNQYQTSIAASTYAAAGDFYTASGTPDAIVLDAVAPRKALAAYTNGQQVRFRPTADNTGPATADVQLNTGRAVKPIKKPDGASPLEANDIVGGADARIEYDLGNGVWRLVGYVEEATTSRAGVARIVTSPEMDNGVLTDVIAPPSEISRIIQLNDYKRGDVPANFTVANQYTATTTPVFSSYTVNQSLTVFFAISNTGAATLNVNGVSAAAIHQPSGHDLQSGDILPFYPYELIYDVAGWRMTNLPDADQAQILAGVSEALTVTPAGLQLRTATQTRIGLLAKATKAEAEGHVDDIKAMTSLRVKEALGIALWQDPTIVHAWVSYDHTNPPTPGPNYNVHGFNNVSGVVPSPAPDNNATINFTWPFANANYSVSGGCNAGTFEIIAKTTSTLQIGWTDFTNDTFPTIADIQVTGALDGSPP